MDHKRDYGESIPKYSAMSYGDKHKVVHLATMKKLVLPEMKSGAEAQRFANMLNDVHDLVGAGSAMAIERQLAIKVTHG